MSANVPNADCYELAGTFLEDEPDLDSDDARHRLSVTILEAIEDWLDAEKEKFLLREKELGADEERNEPPNRHNTPSDP